MSIASYCRLFALTLCLCSTGAQALPDYPHVTLIEENVREEPEYRVPLGAFKKVNSIWRARRSEQFSGKLERATFEVIAGHGVEDVRQFYSRLMLDQGGRELYFCEGFTCGSSNTWANNHYQIKQLYGLDATQFYAVWALGKDKLLSVYSVRRGNKRVYLQREILDLSGAESLAGIAASPVSISHALLARGYYVLPDSFSGEAADIHFQALVKALMGRRSVKVALVASDNEASAGTLDEIIENLSQSGIAKRRLSKVSAADVNLEAALAQVDRGRLVLIRN